MTISKEIIGEVKVIVGKDENIVGIHGFGSRWAHCSPGTDTLRESEEDPGGFLRFRGARTLFEAESSVVDTVLVEIRNKLSGGEV